MTKRVTSTFIAKVNQNQAQKACNKVSPLFIQMLVIFPRPYGMENKDSLLLVAFERDILPLHAHQHKMSWQGQI